ncbi:hypothetical protein RVM27_07085 [Halomonas sp. KM007]
MPEHHYQTAGTVLIRCSASHAPIIDNLQRRIREITQIQSLIDPEILQKVRRTLESIESPVSNEAVNRAVDKIRSLRNQLAHRTSSQETPRAPRPAYRLEDDQDGWCLYP